jgi:hypothetical protein
VPVIREHVLLLGKNVPAHDAAFGTCLQNPKSRLAERQVLAGGFGNQIIEYGVLEDAPP